MILLPGATEETRHKDPIWGHGVSEVLESCFCLGFRAEQSTLRAESSFWGGFVNLVSLIEVRILQQRPRCESLHGTVAVSKARRSGGCRDGGGLGWDALLKGAVSRVSRRRGRTHGKREAAPFSPTRPLTKPTLAPPLPGSRVPPEAAPAPRLRDMRGSYRAPALFPSPPPLPSRLCHGDTEWPHPGPTPRDPRPGNRPGASPAPLPGVPALGRAPRSGRPRPGRHLAPCRQPAPRMRGAGPGRLLPALAEPGSAPVLPAPGRFSLAPLGRREFDSTGSGREGSLRRQVPASWRSFKR